MKKVLIKEVCATKQGVSLNLTNKASLNGRLNSKEWFVSWDTIGRALFGAQYLDADVDLNTLRTMRGEIQLTEKSNA